jgi:hypothetical protein
VEGTTLEVTEVDTRMGAPLVEAITVERGVVGTMTTDEASEETAGAADDEAA